MIRRRLIFCKGNKSLIFVSGLMGSTGNKKVIQDLKDESDTLKSAVHRLNVELSRYQARDVHLSPKKEVNYPWL